AAPRVMKRLCYCIWIVPLLVAGCSRQRSDVDAWSPAQEVARTSDSLTGSFTLYRWNNSLLTLGGDDGTAGVRTFDQRSNSWRTLSTGDLGWSPGAIDPKGNGLMTAGATVLKHAVKSEFTVGTLESDGRLKPSNKTPFPLSQTDL